LEALKLLNIVLGALSVEKNGKFKPGIVHKNPEKVAETYSLYFQTNTFYEIVLLFHANYYLCKS